MPETDMRALASHKRRRGVVRASIIVWRSLPTWVTRLWTSTKLGELEGSADRPDTHLLRQHEEQLSEFKKDVRNALLPLDLADDDEVLQLWRKASSTSLLQASSARPCFSIRSGNT